MTFSGMFLDAMCGIRMLGNLRHNLFFSVSATDKVEIQAKPLDMSVP